MSGKSHEAIVVSLTEQQVELLDEVRTEMSLDSIEEVMTRALHEFAAQEPYHLLWRRFQPASAGLSTSGTRSGRRLFEPGAQREKISLKPVSGKALLVRAGEVLRIRQVDGEQCVDFNAFSWNDYDERMSVGHSRRQGFRLVEGDVLISNRHRPLLYISHMPNTCVTDLLGARCNSPMFEKKFGFVEKKHTNCQDTLAESIREYGLSSDDVHDSFNMWMNTNWDSSGSWWVEWNSATPTDFVDLLACEDTLCVPVICGSGDIHPTSNFFLRPIEVEIYSSSPTSLQVAEEIRRVHSSVHAGGRTGTDSVQADRRLSPIEGYQPSFLRYPLQIVETEVAQPSQIVEERLHALVDNGWATDVGDAARKAVMLWYLRNAGRNNASVGGRFRW